MVDTNYKTRVMDIEKNSLIHSSSGDKTRFLIPIHGKEYYLITKSALLLGR